MDGDRDVPAGFVPLRFVENPYIGSVGPLHAREDDGRLVLGLRVEKRHCSSSGYCHGGMLLTVADMLLVVGSNLQTRQRRFMTTVSLSADFLATVALGSWLEARLEVLRATRNLVFCQGLLTVGGLPVVRTDGIARPIGEVDERYTFDFYLGRAGGRTADA